MKNPCNKSLLNLNLKKSIIFMSVDNSLNTLKYLITSNKSIYISLYRYLHMKPTRAQK